MATVTFRPKRTRQVGIRLPEKTHGDLSALAVRHETTVSEIVRSVVEDWIRKEIGKGSL